jgi:hypothetical protein
MWILRSFVWADNLTKTSAGQEKKLSFNSLRGRLETKVDVLPELVSSLVRCVSFGGLLGTEFQNSTQASH